MNGFHPEYIRAAIENETKRVAIAAVSTRNNALNRAAFNLASLGVTGSKIIHSLRPAALQSGLKKGEIYSTINSGMRAGRQHPRSAPAWFRPVRAAETCTVGISDRNHEPPENFQATSDLKCDAPDKFKVGSDDGPSKQHGELRRHTYRRSGCPSR